jgi:hypothetical protein
MANNPGGFRSFPQMQTGEGRAAEIFHGRVRLKSEVKSASSLQHLLRRNVEPGIRTSPAGLPPHQEDTHERK